MSHGTKLLVFGSHRRTLGGKSLETGLDARHRTTGAACFTLEEVESGVFLEDRVRGTTGVAGDVLLDVSTEDVLDLLGLEATLDDQLRVSVNGTTGTQLSEQKVQQMLLLSVQHFANLCEVGERRLLRTNA